MSWDTLEERMAAKTHVTDGCWLWTGAKRKGGYGTTTINEDGKTTFLSAHRASWLLHRGPISEGMYVCHHCDEPACVNPAHLFIGTNSDNIKDAQSKGVWMRPFQRGLDNPNGKLSPRQKFSIILAAWGGESYASLSKRFGVTAQHIGRIVRNATGNRLGGDR